MRDFNNGDEIASMTLEHYPGMTENVLRDLETEAKDQWDIGDILILHRTGLVKPSDSIVVVCVRSAHREDAFAACRSVMESLKSMAPFWKKEVLGDGSSRWVESNARGN